MVRTECGGIRFNKKIRPATFKVLFHDIEASRKLTQVYEETICQHDFQVYGYSMAQQALIVPPG